MLFDSFPKSQNVQYFTGPDWVTWQKPAEKEFAFIYCACGGGGGGGGFSAAAGNGRGGGGSGSSGPIFYGIVPLFLFPKTLYLLAGKGGAGVSSGTAGAGTVSRVAVAPTTIEADQLFTSTVSTISGAGTGTSVAAGAGGVTSTVTLSASFMALLGAGDSAVRGYVNGCGGMNGGTPTVEGGTQIWGDSFDGNIGFTNTGGCSGAGVTSTDTQGGTMAFNSGGQLISAGIPTRAPAGSNNGPHGYLSLKPFFSYPGSGGASSNAGVGGNGGNGGLGGAGGGGGGGGTTGGRGGDGGDGLIIIITW